MVTSSVFAPPRATLEPAHRRWLLLNALLIPAAVNAILNGGIAWLTSQGEGTVPLASLPLVGKPSTMTDTLGTLFILPFVTTMLVTLSVRHDQRTGRLPHLEPPLKLRQVMAHLSDNSVWRAVAFGTICLWFIGPLAALAVGLTGFGDIAEPSFVFYKVIFGVCLGLVVTPLIAVAAMADRSPRTRPNFDRADVGWADTTAPD